jgi:hypothetical protein
VATFCLAVLVFGCKVENVIQNNLTIDGFIFYATLMTALSGSAPNKKGCNGAASALSRKDGGEPA